MNQRVFIKSKEIEVPEGHELEFIADAETGGFQVCVRRAEQNNRSGIGYEERLHYVRTYYNSAGDEVVRVEGATDWAFKMNRESLPSDYRSARA